MIRQNLIDVETVDATTVLIAGTSYARGGWTVAAFDERNVELSGPATIILAVGSAVDQRRPPTLVALITALNRALDVPVDQSDFRPFFVWDSSESVTADGETDDTAAVNALVWSALSATQGPVVVQLPAGRIKTSGPIHLNYGDAYRSITLRGAGRVYAGSTVINGTCIVATHNDAPAINFQGVRGGRLESLSVVGVNHDHLHGGTNLTLETATADARDIAQWRSAALTSNANASSVTAPYAGVTVDAYSGTRPGTSYPDMALPSGVTGQWGKLNSSGVVLEDVYIGGFEVGLCSHPSGSDSQGEFISVYDSQISSNVYGISVCQTQARNLICSGVQMQFTYTCLTNNKHGVQSGRMAGIFTGCSFIHCMKVVDFTTTFVGETTFLSCSGEAVYRLGDYSSNVASSHHPQEFINCNWNLVPLSPLIGLPASILSGANTPVRFTGGLLYLQNIALVDCQDVVFDGVKVRLDDYINGSTFTLAERKAVNASMGLLVRLDRLTVNQQRIYMTSHFPSVASDSKGAYSSGSGFKANGRNATLPYCVSHILDADSKPAPEYAAPYMATPILCAKTNTTTSIAADGTGTVFAVLARWGGLFPAAGDLLWSDETKALFRVDSVSINGTTDATATVSALTGITAGALDTTESASAGNWYLLRSGVYLAKYPTMFTATASSASLTAVEKGDGVATHLETGMVGDYAIPTPGRPVFTMGTKITALDTGAKTMTMSKVATHAAVDRVQQLYCRVE